jgi:uncharacterized membrane protein
MKRIIIILGILCLSLLATVLVTHYDVMAKDDTEISQCMADCASQQEICTSHCSGDAQCNNRCADAYGRCSSKCYE